MRTFTVAVLTFFVAASSIVTAQESPAPPQPVPARAPDPEVLPYGAAPIAPSAHAPQNDFAPTPAASRRPWHLLRAAEHLEAAGMHDAAKSLRARAQRAHKELIDAKLAEIDRLMAEVNRLKAGHRATASRGAQQILLQVKAVEISLTKLRALGFDVKRFGSTSVPKLACLLTDPQRASDAITIELDPGSGLAGLIHALEQAKIAKVLAEPNVVTVDRRPASYLVGGEIPQSRDGDQGEPQAARTFGTEIHFVPIKLDDHRLKMELRARIAQLDPQLDRIEDGQTIPGVRSVEVDTGCEMEFGQTAVIAGLVQERLATPASGNAKVERELIATVFLLRPELVQIAAPLQAQQPAASR